MFLLSLPMRERGLKLNVSFGHLNLHLSLPMRERGLKWKEWEHHENCDIVAPHAGAWIEI